MIRMAVFDLDETLFRTDKTVSEFTVQTLTRLRDSGVRLAFATARGQSAAKMLPRGLFSGNINMNGATATADGEVIYSRLIPPSLYRQFLITLTENGIDAAAEIERRHYTNYDESTRRDQADYFEIVDFATLEGDAEKLYAYVDNDEQVSIVQRAIPEGLYVYFGKDGFSMIMHKDASKKNAVLALAAHWGISADEIVAFGDDVNDIDMLQCCGTAVAMGNALDSVKAVATDTCGTNDDDGVANWLTSNVITK